VDVVIFREHAADEDGTMVWDAACKKLIQNTTIHTQTTHHFVDDVHNIGSYSHSQSPKVENECERVGS
jgi:hypothetical protein